MRVVIHRGTHQIGGCITEIGTEKTRIMIDFGSELDAPSDNAFHIDGVTGKESNCDAVFFSHYHGDHTGLLETINADIPLYIGEAAKRILEIYSERIHSDAKERISSMKTFTPLAEVTVGDIKITPFLTDHSAYDAYMFLIEAEGKKILHTGDFRSHGFRGKAVIPTLSKYVGKVNALILEGTALGRTRSACMTENELKYRIKEVLDNNKYVFAVCSSTNIDRIASICSVVPRGKYCLCDNYQYDIVKCIRETAGDKSSLYEFEKMNYYAPNLDEKMKAFGFCMFIRSGQPFKKFLDEYKDAVIIYSMWGGYLEDAATAEFFKGHRVIKLHASGHADIDTLVSVVETVKPDKIIPIHTAKPEMFDIIADKSKLINAKDKEEIII